MPKVKIPVIFYILILALLAGCDLPDPAATPTPTWDPKPPSPNDLADDAVNDPIPLAEAGAVAIATPPGADFWLLSAEPLTCNSSKYMVVKIINRGGMPFTWSNVGIVGEGYTKDLTAGDSPFYPNPNECPTQEGDDKLASGKTAYLYAELIYNTPAKVIKIEVELCTQYPPYMGECILREMPYDADVMIGPGNIFLVEEVLCRVGPGPRYDVVRTMKAGEIVDLAARSQVDGYLVVKDTKYGLLCYIREGGIELPEGFDLYSLPEITPPPLPPTATPTPTNTPIPRIQIQTLVGIPSATKVPPPN